MTSDISTAADLRTTVCTAEPGAPSDDALGLLASWAATHTASAPDPATSAADNR
ncbi:hypothetical protein ACI8AC_24985 [Geodermatophilus sp. SYSU D00758]